MRFIACSSLLLLMRLLLINSAPVPEGNGPASLASDRTVVVTDDHSFSTGSLFKASTEDRNTVIGSSKHPGSRFPNPSDHKFIAAHYTRSCTFANGTSRSVTIRHAIVLDAGSSSTKVQYYQLEFCGDSFYAIHGKELKERDPLKNDKLSDLEAYVSSEAVLRAKVAQYVSNVVNYATMNVPAGVENKTIIALMATAGMRLKGADKALRVMELVGEGLVAYTKKLCKEKGKCYIIPPGMPAARIIGGDEEGVWAWITSNFYEHKIGYQSLPGKDSSNPRTSAIMDVGGASTQLVFEITPDDVKSVSDLYPASMNPIRTITLEGHNYPLFQQSFLHFGNDEIRRRVGSKYYEVADGIDKDAYGYTSRYESKEEMIEKDYVDFTDIKRFICVHDYLQRDTYDPAVKLSGRITTETRNASKPCQYWVRMAFHPDGYGPHLNATPSTYYPCMETLYKSPKIRGINTLSYYIDHFTSGQEKIVTMDRLTEIREWVCDKKEPQGDRRFKEPGPRWTCHDAVYLEVLFKESYALPSHVEVDVSQTADSKAISWTLGAALNMISIVDKHTKQTTSATDQSDDSRVIKCSTNANPYEDVCIIV